MPDWFANGKFHFYTPIGKNSATLSVSQTTGVVEALAADCAKFTTAAIESMEGIDQRGSFPKSVGWLTIRSYYAAFFSAHAILRVLGVSCTQFESAQVSYVNAVANVYGMGNGVSLGGGLYECVVDATSNHVKLTKRNGSGGSHIMTWKVLLRELRRVIQSIPGAGILSADAQILIARLTELEFAMTDEGGNGAGSWMPNIRNRVNYRLELGAWFPYGERREYYDKLFTAARLWKNDPLSITISPRPGRELQCLVECAAILVGIARELSIDLAARCPNGTSMQKYACLSMLNQLAA